jgi:RHS repeat-associated protein
MTGTTWATGFTYNAAQQPTTYSLYNGVSASLGYSPDRLQLNSLSYTKSSTTLFSLSYLYGTSGSNDGLISSITDNVQSGRSVTYTYDSLARLSTALTSGSSSYPQWGLQWTYDRYANRTQQKLTAGTGPSNLVTVSVTTNQITGSPYAYDLSGNMTNDGFNTLVYDAENRATSATNTGSSGAYTYDGNGLRVTKCVGSCSTNTRYIRSGSQVIAEYSSTASPSAPNIEYIYAGSTLIASEDNTNTYRFYQRDNLSNRLVTDISGNVIEQLAHYPYGEAWYNSSGDKLLFTSYERDAESGNDYAQARYYVNRLGRFSAADPLSGNTGDPQSLNRYAYVENLPILLIDPSGACDQLIQSFRHKLNSDSDVSGWGLFLSELGETIEAESAQGASIITPIDCFWPDSGGGGGDGGWGPAFPGIEFPNGCVKSIICVNVWAPYIPGDASDGGPSEDGYGIIPSPTVDQGGGGGGTTWLQTKVFFQALGRNFIDEFKPGGCVAAFTEGADKADFLGAIPPGQPIIEDAIKGTAATVAANYAATQALTVPLRSSVVRGILATGETAAAYVAPVYLLGLTVSGAIAEGKAIVNGTCH